MRRPGRTARIVRSILAFGVLAVTVPFNVAVLVEAYGAGPPYYGRTTSMDKWTDPMPWLLAIDAAAIAVVLVLVFRKPRGSR